MTLHALVRSVMYVRQTSKFSKSKIVPVTISIGVESAAPLYGRLAVTRLPNTEDRRRSRKPARCDRSFVGICQEFIWLSLQIPEPTSHTANARRTGGLRKVR